jgi:nicotinamidase/pyrazinamidase
MMNRRQVVSGLGAAAFATLVSERLWAASIKPDEASALLVIDVQNCFLPGGSLAVKDGEQVVPVINKLARAFSNVVMTQDWHTGGHISFASSHSGKKPFETVDLNYGKQVLWPDHCVQGTTGAEFHAGLQVPHAELIIRKGYRREIDSYSAFYENDHKTPTGLAGYLRERGLVRVFLAGLAFDFCVRYSAEDAHRCGFAAVVIEDACRGIDIGGSMDATRRRLAELAIPCATADAVG